VDDPQKPNEFKKDVHLSDKINSWTEAFMHILLEHYKEYLVHGLVEPPQVKNATHQYKKDSNIYQEFIDDNLEHSDDPDDYVTINHMWCIFRNGHGQIKRKEFVTGITKILGAPIEEKRIKKTKEKNFYTNYLFVHSKSDVINLLEDD
jgi:phage/plasmid-associated DNA primase